MISIEYALKALSVVLRMKGKTLALGFILDINSLVEIQCYML